MSSSVPGAALTVLGVALVVIGILVAGSFELIALGIAALVFADAFESIGRRRTA